MHQPRLPPPAPVHPCAPAVMDVAVIGAGSVGATLARGWARAGHRVVLAVRAPSDPKHAPLAPLPLKTVADAAQGASVIVLATPWGAAQDALGACGEALAGKVLVDATNPIYGRLEGMRPSGDDSGGETVRLAPGRVRAGSTCVLSAHPARTPVGGALGPGRPCRQVLQHRGLERHGRPRGGRRARRHAVRG